MFDRKTPATLVSSLALAAVLAVTSAFAQDTTQPPTSETNSAVSESVQDEATTQVDERRAALLKDATRALEETENALNALDDGDTEAAVDALAIATGRLQSVVARDSGLALAPVDVQLLRRDLVSDLETIEAAREVIEDLVSDGRLQEARPLMRDFASEIVIETSNLPLATYPDAILRATAQIDAGEIDAAKQTLATALSTVVFTEEVIALPVLRAQLLIEAAEEALDGSADTAETEATETAEAEPSQPGEYVEAARVQLQMAEALGYGEEGDFEELYDNLDELDEKIDLADDTGGIFDRIGDSFIRLKQRLFD